jgi:tetratricopeptide (TPR) repeat protein
MDQVQKLIKTGEEHIREGRLEKASHDLAKAITVLDERGHGRVDQMLLAETLRLRAYCGSRMGDYINAARDAKRAMDISKGLSDVEGEADALRRLGYLHWQKADYSMAVEFYNAALEKAALCKADLLTGKIKIEIGNVHLHKKEHDKAERMYLDALKIMKDGSDLKELARLYNNLGACYLNSERYSEAVVVLKKCELNGKKVGDLTIQGWANFNIAEGLLKLGRPRDAIKHLYKAMALLRRQRDRSGIASAHLNYGLAYAALGQWDKAKVHFNGAIKMEQAFGMTAIVGEAFREIGKAYLKKGDKAIARKYLEKALKVYEEADLSREAKEIKKLMNR